MDEKASKLSDIEKLGYQMAWESFQFHALQRIHFFNFSFIVIGAVMILQINTLIGQNCIDWVVVATGLFQVFVCYVFYKFDARNKFLTKNTEEIIIEYEKHFTQNNLALMTLQENKTQELRKKMKRVNFLTNQHSFSILITLFYIVFAIVGLTLAICALL